MVCLIRIILSSGENALVKMTRAFDQDGHIVSIDHVKNGQNCGCTCIVCGRSLSAKQGLRNAHHFAHITQCNCHWSGETELHLLAKEVLLADKRLSFTWLSLDNSPYNIELHFSDVQQEVTLGSIRPDIIGITTDGESVVVEICVTHPCEDSKIFEFRRQAQNVIEVLLPKELLADVDVMKVDFVRDAIAKSEKKCLSFNPLSEFCKSMYQLNADVIKDQGATLRTIRKDISTESHKLQLLNNQIVELEMISRSWEVKAQEINERAKNYANKLYTEIRSQKHVKQYFSEKLKYETLISELVKEHSNAVNKAKRDLAEYETKLKKDFRDRLKASEPHRLKQLQDELLEFSDGTLLQVDQYIQMISERYENRFDELERNWIVLERKLARLNEHEVRPEFVQPDNRKLPPLNQYKKLRG